jgi:hypothetical protein
VTQVLNQRHSGASSSRPHHPSLSRPALLSLLMQLPACYGGDFFDRLVDPDATAAFRIVQLTLVDPHTYSGDMVECNDSTPTYNAIFAQNIDKFDTNTTLVLRPLDPKVDRDTLMDIVPAVCVPGEAIVNCTDKNVPTEKIITAGFNNIEGGTCLAPVAGSLNPVYMGGTNEPLHAPRSPCLVSAMIPSLNLNLAPTLSLPLSNVQISAAYQLDGESQKLVQGVIRGFLPSSVAMSPIGTLADAPFTPWGLLAGGGGCTLDTSDIDTVTVPNDGVWMYFNFTAERVAWTSTPPSGTETAGTTDATTDPTAAMTVTATGTTTITTTSL